MTKQFKVTMKVSSVFTDLIHVEIISFVVAFSLILIIALLNLIVCIINCKLRSNSFCFLINKMINYSIKVPIKNLIYVIVNLTALRVTLNRLRKF